MKIRFGVPVHNNITVYLHILERHPKDPPYIRFQGQFSEVVENLLRGGGVKHKWKVGVLAYAFTCDL